MPPLKLFPDPADEPSFDVGPRLRTNISLRVLHQGELREVTMPSFIFLTPNPSAFEFGSEPSSRKGEVGPSEECLTRLCIDIGGDFGWIQYRTHAEAVNAVERLAVKLLDAASDPGGEMTDEVRWLTVCAAAHNFYYSEPLEYQGDSP